MRNELLSLHSFLLETERWKKVNCSPSALRLCLIFKLRFVLLLFCIISLCCMVDLMFFFFFLLSFVSSTFPLLTPNCTIFQKFFHLHFEFTVFISFAVSNKFLCMCAVHWCLYAVSMYNTNICLFSGLMSNVLCVLCKDTKKNEIKVFFFLRRFTIMILFVCVTFPLCLKLNVSKDVMKGEMNVQYLSVHSIATWIFRLFIGYFLFVLCFVSRHTSNARYCNKIKFILR